MTREKKNTERNGRNGMKNRDRRMASLAMAMSGVMLMSSCAQKQAEDTSSKDTRAIITDASTSSESSAIINNSVTQNNSVTLNDSGSSDNGSAPKEDTTAITHIMTKEMTTGSNSLIVPLTDTGSTSDSTPETVPATEADSQNGNMVAPVGELEDEGSYMAVDNTVKDWSHGYPADLSQYNGIYALEPGQTVLSFDLGYEAGYTEKLLDILKEKDAKAMFFLTGTYIEQNKALVDRMLAEVHVIGQHGYDHVNMSKLSENGTAPMLEDISKWENAMGQKTKFYRAPEGKYSDRGMKILSDLGYTSVYWGLAYRDWEENSQPDPTEAINKLKNDFTPGDVILLHVFDTNIKILPEFIDWLRSEGNEIVLPQ